MQRRRWTRLSGLLFGALWCAAVVARPSLRVCPMGSHHAAHVEQSEPASEPASEHADHTVLLQAAVNAEDTHEHSHDNQQKHQQQADSPATLIAPTDSPTQNEHSGQPCDCLGECCGTSVVATPIPSLTLAFALLESAAPPGIPQHEFIAHWIDFVLPFATAPPSMTLG